MHDEKVPTRSSHASKTWGEAMTQAAVEVWTICFKDQLFESRVSFPLANLLRAETSKETIIN
jgi:hypothetical protein